MELYRGIDLHSTNSYVVVLDRDDRVVFQRRLANDLDVIIPALAPFAADIAGVVVESTYNPKSGSWRADFRPAQHRISGFGCRDQAGR